MTAQPSLLRRQPSVSRWWWLPPLVGLTALFGPPLWRAENFAFRDTSHYYHPLFAWIARQTVENGLPLWNPMEDMGVSLVADPTAALFYPFKLLLLLPCSYDFNLKLYIVVHFLIAAVGMYRYVHGIGRSVAAASLSAVAYTIGGNVLIQYANIPYLVGAAWLPITVRGFDIAWRYPTWRAAIRAAMPWALMVLGGDVQLAFHLGLLFVAWAYLARRVQPNRRASGTVRPPARLRVLFLAISMFIGLAAIQLVPSVCHTKETTRALVQHARNPYEWLAEWWWESRTSSSHKPDDVAVANWPSTAGMRAIARPGDHHQTVFQFSVGPWRWIEFFWPNVSGRQFPIAQRWMDGLPAEGRVWTPSMYLGFCPAIGALIAFRIRRGGLRRRWHSWLCLFSLLAALGEYGFVWAAHEILSACGSAWRIPAGGAVGGVYWGLTQLVPGYVQFRYPAKWCVITQFAIAVLAASAVDFCRKNSQKSHHKWITVCACLITMSCLAMVGLHVGKPTIITYFHTITADRLFGPFHAVGAWWDVNMSFLHTAIVGLTTIVLLVSLCRFSPNPSGTLWGLVWLTTIELTLAQHWMVVTAPSRYWYGSTVINAAKPNSVDGTDASQTGKLPERWYRARHVRAWPAEWSATSDRQRQELAVAYEHLTLYPKHHLLANIGLVGTTCSMPRADFAAMLAELTHSARQQNRMPDESELKLFALTGIIDNNKAQYVDPQPAPIDRVMLTDDLNRIPTLRRRGLDALVEQTRRICSAYRANPSTVIVESDEPLRSPTTSDSAPLPARTSPATVQWISFHPNQLQLRVTTDRPQWLVLAEQYDVGWRATIRSDDMPNPRDEAVYRANRVWRGIPLDAGSQTVTLTYHPPGLRFGSVCSAVAWLVAGVSFAQSNLKIQLGLHIFGRVGAHP